MKYRLVIPEDGLTREEIEQIAIAEKSIIYLYNSFKEGKIYDEAEVRLLYPKRCIVKLEPKTHREIIHDKLGDRLIYEKQEVLELMQLAVENEKLKD